MRKKLMIAGGAVLLLAAVVLVYIFVFGKNLRGRIVLPYIAHQQGLVDPHVPSAVPLADKLDEVLFDGLFNISANSSGITYEDGLGELVGIDEKNVVTVRLKKNQKWHSSFTSTMEKDKITVAPGSDVFFGPQDLKFSLERIRKFGSLSPDYILVAQAVPNFDFAGPDENNDIRFQFKGDRIWSDADIKEILSFKILPYNSEMAAGNYTVGTGPYLTAGEYEKTQYYATNPARGATIPRVLLKPYIDNSTFITELKNRNINALLGSPFGEISPILRDTADYFHKPTIATTFFALLFNTERLNLEQRQALRALVESRKVMDRFFKISTPQQRHIANYKGPNDNYDEYLNRSVFPATSYYISEKVVVPAADSLPSNPAVLPDTVRIQTCLNYQFREELTELVTILNDPALCGGKLRVTAVANEELARGAYDAVLVPVSGYRSNFLFDLYGVFLQEPDFSASRIHLLTTTDLKGNPAVDTASFTADKNYLRLDLLAARPDQADLKLFLDNMYRFMSASEIGDKQAYAQMVDAQEHKLALGAWLFSLPSLAYFNTQFDAATIDLYGTASQLSTIEKWQEEKKK